VEIVIFHVSDALAVLVFLTVIVVVVVGFVVLSILITILDHYTHWKMTLLNFSILDRHLNSMLKDN
jgi:hypothetical protein